METVKQLAARKKRINTHIDKALFALSRAQNLVKGYDDHSGRIQNDLYPLDSSAMAAAGLAGYLVDTLRQKLGSKRKAGTITRGVRRAVGYSSP